MCCSGSCSTLPPCGATACDGQGGCVYPTTSCFAECGGGFQYEASCSQGSCPNPTTTACGAFACGASACLTQCTSAGDCVDGNSCNGTVCEPGDQIAGEVTIIGPQDPSGVTVTLDAGSPDGGYQLTTTTDGSGDYAFTSLLPGNYGLTLEKTVVYPPTDDLLLPDGGRGQLLYSAQIPDVVIYVDGGTFMIDDVDDSVNPFTTIELAAGVEVTGFETGAVTGLIIADGGGAFAYSESNKLYLQPAGGSASAVGSSFGVGGYGFTSSASHLYFLNDGNSEGSTLQMVPSSGGSAVAGPSGISGGQFTIAPDDAHVAWLTNSSLVGSVYVGTLEVGSTVGNSSTQLANAVPFYEEEFSPDGTRIAYLTSVTSNNGNYTGTLEVMTLATGAVAAVGTGVPWNGGSPIGGGFHFTPDSQNLVFLTSYGGALYTGTMQVYNVAAQTTSTGISSVYQFYLSPNSTTVGYLTGAQALDTYAISTGTVTPISSSADDFIFSPDMKYIAYRDVSWNLWVYTVSSGASVQMGSTVASDCYQFSPQGGWIAFLNNTTLNRSDFNYYGTLTIAPETNNQAEQVILANMPDYAFEYGYSRFTPDGNHFLFFTGYGYSGNSYTGSLASAVSATGNITDIGGPMPMEYGYQITPDGSAVAFLSNLNQYGYCDLGAFAVASGAIIPLNHDIDPQQWGIAGSQMLGVRTETPAPYRFMDGLWVSGVP